MSPQHNTDDVHKLRQEISKVLAYLGTFGGSRELSLVKTKLQEAKMWAGKELENLGSELPAEYRDEAPSE